MANNEQFFEHTEYELPARVAGRATTRIQLDPNHHLAPGPVNRLHFQEELGWVAQVRSFTSSLSFLLNPSIR